MAGEELVQVTLKADVDYSKVKVKMRALFEQNLKGSTRTKRSVSRKVVSEV